MAETVFDKSIKFAVRVVNLYKYLCAEKKEFIMSRQLLRSGTSVGANLREARYAQSTDDFIHKNPIALKEITETGYWHELLTQTEYLTQVQYEDMEKDCTEILKMLTAIVKKAKQNK